MHMSLCMFVYEQIKYCTCMLQLSTIHCHPIVNHRYSYSVYYTDGSTCFLLSNNMDFHKLFSWLPITCVLVLTYSSCMHASYLESCTFPMNLSLFNSNLIFYNKSLTKRSTEERIQQCCSVTISNYNKLHAINHVFRGINIKYIATYMKPICFPYHDFQCYA